MDNKSLFSNKAFIHSACFPFSSKTTALLSLSSLYTCGSRPKIVVFPYPVGTQKTNHSSPTRPSYILPVFLTAQRRQHCSHQAHCKHVAAGHRLQSSHTKLGTRKTHPCSPTKQLCSFLGFILSPATGLYQSFTSFFPCQPEKY